MTMINNRRRYSTTPQPQRVVFGEPDARAWRCTRNGICLPPQLHRQRATFVRQCTRCGVTCTVTEHHRRVDRRAMLYGHVNSNAECHDVAQCFSSSSTKRNGVRHSRLATTTMREPEAHHRARPCVPFVSIFSACVFRGAQRCVERVCRLGRMPCGLRSYSPLKLFAHAFPRAEEGCLWQARANFAEMIERCILCERLERTKAMTRWHCSTVFQRAFTEPDQAMS